MPLERRTRAILRKAEFGFLGVMVLTERQTPRLKDELKYEYLFFKLLYEKVSAGDLVLRLDVFLDFLTNWLIVGIFCLQV